MNDLLAIAAQNTIVAGILGILVFGLTRLWRRPPVAHILWLLVLAKLIGPPVLHVDVTGLLARRPTIEPGGGGPDLARESSFPGARPRTAFANKGVRNQFRLSEASEGIPAFQGWPLSPTPSYLTIVIARTSRSG